jgi:hypothetical protein
MTRRYFLAAVPAAAAAGAIGLKAAAAAEKPALLGGKKVRTEPFPVWPKFDQREESALLETLHSGKWYRGNGKNVSRFEEAYARLTGAKCCLATANGTSALFISLNALGVEPGDEVLVPPYTFVATINVVLRQHALPVFIDSDIETSQIDARKVEEAINERTRAIIPVHLGGNAADLDALLPIAKKHKIPLIEDACQAHLGEWRGRKVRTSMDLLDRLSLTFEWPNDIQVAYEANQLTPRGYSKVGEEFTGTKGTIQTSRGGLIHTKGPAPNDVENIKSREPTADAMEEFANRILSGDVENVAERSARSTLIALLGREATYSRKEVTWKGLFGSV